TVAVQRIEQRRAFVNLPPWLPTSQATLASSPVESSTPARPTASRPPSCPKSFPHKRMVDIGAARTLAKAAPSAACQQSRSKPKLRDFRCPNWRQQSTIDGMLPPATLALRANSDQIDFSGGTYRNLCDESVNEFLAALARRSACEGDPAVRDHLNFWADRKPRADGKASESGAANSQDNPSRPGAARYHADDWRNGLEMFNSETKNPVAPGLQAATGRACGPASRSPSTAT
uniref:PEROXIDASE_4 domain-containing protein n=1 Tax=Macrostomum lignano TaxID=282301 RepID=A0A1I8JNV7_9PLAT